MSSRRRGYILGLVLLLLALFLFVLAWQTQFGKVLKAITQKAKPTAGLIETPSGGGTPEAMATGVPTQAAPTPTGEVSTSVPTGTPAGAASSVLPPYPSPTTTPPPYPGPTNTPPPYPSYP